MGMSTEACAAHGTPWETAAGLVRPGSRMTVLVEAFGDVTVDSLAAEARVVRHAVPERRREHATVRACARAALVQLGQRPVPILNDPDGVPVWPLGVVGSLTHCRGYRGCAGRAALRPRMRRGRRRAAPAAPCGGGRRRAPLGGHQRPARRLACRPDRLLRQGGQGMVPGNSAVPGVHRRGDPCAHRRQVHRLHQRDSDLRGRWSVRGGYVLAVGMIPVLTVGSDPAAALGDPPSCSPTWSRPTRWRPTRTSSTTSAPTP